MSAQKTTHVTTNPEETEALGMRLADQLRGRIVLLRGELGAGKTTFVRGLARGFGVTELVKSPTFVYEKIYTGNTGLVVHHLDLYRFEKIPAEFTEHLRELFASGDTIIIEWPERIFAELLPLQRVELHFKEIDEGREIVINEKMM